MSRLVERLAAGTPAPYARAVLGGHAADRVGLAFAAGYQAALRALVPSLPAGVASLAASEAGGAHPRAITTTLAFAAPGSRVTGTKTFATQGPDAAWFLVLASEGQDAGGRALLRLARVARDAPGLTLEPGPATPFCPEIGHAQLRLDNVPVAEVLPGDGWTDLVKPFRTVEDVHVHGAVLAYVLGAATRHAWPADARAELAGLLLTFGSLAAHDPADASTHVALAGAITSGRRALEAASPHWQLVPEDERARWWRDQPLLRVAERARAARLETAWQALG